MDWLTQPFVKKPRRNGLQLCDVTNTFISSPVPLNTKDEVAVKLLSILEGGFESPGFSNCLRFRHAAHRQKQISQSKHHEVAYDMAWENQKGGRYTRSVADWDWLSGNVFHIRWWSKGMSQICSWDRDLRFWSYEELQEAHIEHRPGLSGPEHDDWCRVDGVIQWDVFWSTALLFKYTGSSGVKTWDDQFEEMRRMTQ